MLFASPATGAVLGMPAAVGTSIFSSVHDSDVEILRTKLSVLHEMTTRTGKPQLMKLHCRMSKQSGGYFQALWRGIADGDVLFLLVLDISSQATRTESAVQQYAHFIRATTHAKRALNSPPSSVLGVKSRIAAESTNG